MNIFIQEMKMAYKSMIYWIISILAFIFIFLTMFPAIAKDAAVMQDIVSNFPPEIIRALGLNVLDLSTLNGYYGFVMTYLLLIASIYSMKLGMTVLSEEMRVKTTDFLLSKPVSRSKIFIAKFFTSFLLIFIQNVLFNIASLLFAKNMANTTFDIKVFLLMNLSIFFVQLFFLGLGLFISILFKELKTVLPPTLGIVFGFFIIQLLNQSIPEAKLAYITPFAYFDINYIITNRAYDNIFFIIDLLGFILFTYLAYIIYCRKDMPSV